MKAINLKAWKYYYVLLAVEKGH